MKPFFTFTLILFFLQSSFSLARKNMEFQDMYNIKIIGNGVVSPDAGKLLFPQSEFRVSENRTYICLWIKDLYNYNNPYKVTYQDTYCTSPSWTPVTNIISYLTKKGEQTVQIYTLNLKGGHSKKLTYHNTSVKAYSWISKNKILFTAEEYTPDKYKKDADAYYYGESSNNLGLWEFDVTTGKEKRITNGRMSVRGFRVAPDGKTIAIIAAPTANACDENKSEIYLYHTDNGSIRQITSNNIMEKQLGWAPDGSYITFISDANEKLEPYYQDAIFRLNPSTGHVSMLTKDFRYQITDHQWDNNNNIIYFLANKGTTQQLFSYDIKTGKTSQNTFVKGVVRSFSLISKTGRIALLISTPESPEDYYITEKGRWNPNRITRSNPQLDSYNLGRYKTFFYKSNGGREVEGILIYPHDYDQHKKYPLLVQLHGGPNASYQLSFGFSWVTYPHFLTAKGYVIFQPNYSGSAGYGNSFMRSIIGSFFTPGYEDIMAGVEHLIKSNIADPERLGVMGFSAGGHFTNWIITHTNKFKVASVGAGLANWMSFYAQNEVQYLREIWMGNPYENTEKWIKHSPISHISNVHTPTFFYCGDQDSRVPFAQTMEMWMGLKRHNIPTRLLVLPKEGHSVNDIRHQIEKMENEYKWIEKFLR